VWISIAVAIEEMAWSGWPSRLAHEPMPAIA
jgi:hypothetical protein